MNKIIILAGGSGSRLWPFSRQYYPKQILKLIGEKSLLQETCLRFENIKKDSISVVTNKEQKFLIEQNLDEIGFNHDSLIIEEPYARNTAAAICLAALSLELDDIMIILPSDHIIPDHKEFQNIIKQSVELAKEDYLVTIGIKPTYPETGYGYIQRGDQLSSTAFKVDSFKEKPSEAIAKEYIRSKDYYWNSGMFVWKVETILSEFKTYKPNIYSHLKSYIATGNSQYFFDVENTSIDYAILEQSKSVCVVGADFRWSDLGSWKSVYEIQDKDESGNVINGNASINNSQNIFIHNTSKERLVAAIGLEDITIIDTDDAVIVCNNEHTQDVKKIVDDLKSKNSELTNLHKTVYRPWGYYKILEDTDYFKSKRLVIYPKQAISLQYHNKRHETWTVVKGIAEVTCDDLIKDLSTGETIQIPAGSKHRIKNNNSDNVEIIEVQTGSYFGEDDIVRIEDQYRRETQE